jgi:adenylyltransferase/sulfurtransferase
MLFDALESTFRELRLRRNAECPACGEHATLHEVTDLEYACALPA